MYGKFQAYLQETIADLKAKSLYKNEKIIATPQGANVVLENGTKLLNMCANNYLGLANHPEIIEASREATAKYGYGMGSVRFICGTDSLHKLQRPQRRRGRGEGGGPPSAHPLVSPQQAPSVLQAPGCQAPGSASLPGPWRPGGEEAVATSRAPQWAPPPPEAGGFPRPGSSALLGSLTALPTL